MSAQVAEDEDYQLRYEVVAGTDVAKESAVACVRLPPAAGRKHWQQLEKLLEDALCKLSAVVSKLAGHQTARAVIEAMIAGERDPKALAALGQGRMRNDKLPALAEALSGMRSGPHHAHAAASLLRAIDLLDAELRDLQERVTAHLAAIPASWGVDSDDVTGPEAGRALTAYRRHRTPGTTTRHGAISPSARTVVTLDG